MTVCRTLDTAHTIVIREENGGWIKMNFGEKVKTLRKTRDLTTTELARMAGLSQSFISDIENGRRKTPTSKTLDKLSAALRVAPSYFIDQDIVTPLDIMPDMPEDVKDFLLTESNMPYLKLSQKAKENGITSGMLEDLLNALISAMNTRKK